MIVSIRGGTHDPVDLAPPGYLALAMGVNTRDVDIHSQTVEMLRQAASPNAPVVGNASEPRGHSDRLVPRLGPYRFEPPHQSLHIASGPADS